VAGLFRVPDPAARVSISGRCQDEKSPGHPVPRNVRGSRLVIRNAFGLQDYALICQCPKIIQLTMARGKTAPSRNGIIPDAMTEDLSMMQ
jgi:hypothetical protein